MSRTIIRQDQPPFAQYCSVVPSDLIVLTLALVHHYSCRRSLRNLEGCGGCPLINEGPTPHNCLSTISSPRLLFPLPASSAPNMASLEIMVGSPALFASSAGVKKLVCRVCQKGFTKAEHLRVSLHVPTNLRGCYPYAKTLQGNHQGINRLTHN